MATESNRFAQLLQPIRDLAKLWQIDLVVELQRYVEELAQIQEEGVPEDSIPKYNFAEGALLLQGSTAIYSRKVEDLYDLVVRALDLLHSEKAAALAGRKGKAGAGGWAVPDTDELLTIDHLIKEGRNITLDSELPEQRLATQRRVPLFLMPRNKEDRRNSEFRISSCTVHSSGVYLLQESDAKLIDEVVSEDDLAQNDRAEPLVPPPPKEVHDLDQQLQELQVQHQQVIADHQMQLVATPAVGAAVGVTPAKSVEGAVTPGRTPMGRTPIAVMAEQLAQSALAPAGDFWALQDEHHIIGQEVPLEVGKASRRVQAAKKLLAGIEALPEVPDQELPGDDMLWSGHVDACPAVTGDPVEQLFLAVGGQLKGCRFETQKAHFSSAWLEFEDLFSVAHNKWRQLRQASGAARLKKTEEEDEEVLTPKKSRPGEDSEEEGFDPVGPTPMKTPGDLGAGVDVEHKRNVEKLEGMIHDAQQAIQDAQQKYEATIRQHLQQTTSAGGDSDSQRFPQLYAVVRAWQEQLEPVLKEFQSRPPFHIMEYSTKLLDKLVEDKKTTGNDGVPFKELVGGLPRYEVCRRFLTALFLTNQGNTDIVTASEQDREGAFRLRVLKADKEWISLEDEPAGATTTATKGRKRSRSRAKSAAPLADAGEPSAKRLTKKSRVVSAAADVHRSSKSPRLSLRRKGQRAQRAGA